MKPILMQVCCANCTLFPWQRLREEGFSIKCYFYNPNIHPYQEYERRVNTFLQLARTWDLDIVLADNYELEEFLHGVVTYEGDRCIYCYTMRLRATAELAKRIHYDIFSTTLLYSKYQKHDKIKSIGEELARQYELDFYYQDFREGWQEGIEVSKKMGLYRQKYCGCIYSEKERYYKPC
jgi:predicted adenine nucleotide alpha hydrolase (AANH) superfamily ATPase